MNPLSNRRPDHDERNLTLESLPRLIAFVSLFCPPLVLSHPSLSLSSFLIHSHPLSHSHAKP